MNETGTNNRDSLYWILGHLGLRIDGNEKADKFARKKVNNRFNYQSHFQFAYKHEQDVLQKGGGITL